MRNIFFEKSFTKYGAKVFPDPFPKNQNWEYFWIISLQF